MFGRQLILALLLVVVGCNGSRWAKRDADYAQKYPHHTDNVAKTIKQSIDARHVRGKGGYYLAGAGRDAPIAAGAEVGVFGYAEPWLEARGGLAGLVHEGGDYPLSGGVIGSFRLQTPTRFAPFIGMGAYGGWAGLESADEDGFDNDDNGFIDEPGESDSAFAIAIFPEVGAHLWLNHRVRLTTSVNYYLTNQGRNDDFLFYSVGLSFFSRDYEGAPAGPPIDYDTPDDWAFIPPDPYAAPTPAADSPYAALTIEGQERLAESPRAVDTQPLFAAPESTAPIRATNARYGMTPE